MRSLHIQGEIVFDNPSLTLDTIMRDQNYNSPRINLVQDYCVIYLQ